jgi:N-acetyl-alpha-D-muramate 1-phosphate uridylyltransferase
MNGFSETGIAKPPTRVSKGIAKAMILAAGLGTRLKPWTDSNPKALAVVNGKSLLQRNIEYLQQFGITDVVINVHHFAEKIIEAIEVNSGWGSNISISDEKDEVLETGGGILRAQSYLQGDDPFLVMNVDILTDMNLASMISYHQEKKPIATLATRERDTSRYFLFDEGNNLCGWRNVNTGEEKMATPPSADGKQVEHTIRQRAFSGIHIIEPKLLTYIHQTGKFSIVDVYLQLMNDHTIKSFDHSESRFIDVGKPGSIETAESMFA